jgi:hypothetical protein
MTTGATGGDDSLATEGASTADGMMDQVFLGFTLKNLDHDFPCPDNYWTLSE